MDRITISMVKSILKDSIDAKERNTASQIYAKPGGKEIVEERYCGQYCLSNTPEVRQAINEYLSS